jgi:hypothetical protein
MEKLSDLFRQLQKLGVSRTISIQKGEVRVEPAGSQGPDERDAPRRSAFKRKLSGQSH